MSSSMYPSGFSPPHMLRVSTRTWMRDSHDLFDYETHQQVKISNFATSAAFKLLRCEADVSVMEYNNMVDKEHDHLLSIISKRNGEYVVVPAEKIPGSLLYPQKLWLIVRTLPYQRYALQENDIIKLGRFRLRVKQLVPAPSSESPNSSSTGDVSLSDPANDAQLVKLFDGLVPEKTITFEEQCNMQCRICLAEGYLHNPSSGTVTSGNTPSNLMSTSNETSLDVDTTTSKMNTISSGINLTNSNTSSITTGSDPNFNRTLSNISDLNVNKGSFESDRLICACECKGSIKYVHVDCLRKWIDSRWNLRSDEPLPPMVFIREVSCELCKTNYPCFIRQNGELIQIVKMPKMAVPFLVLENITPHAIKGVHLLSMKDMKDLKLGRGHESDVRIPDVSISRYHATIRYEQGQFYLEDHDSKFGTLVAMRKPKLVSINEPLAVQVGRSVINLSIDESLPYLQNSVITLTPSVNAGSMNNIDQIDTDSTYNINTNVMNNVVNEGSRVMLGTVSGLMGTTGIMGANGVGLGGVAGTNGVTGLTGTNTGSNGVHGTNGLTGLTSGTGSNVLTGSNGVSGLTGVNSANSANGLTNTTSTTGVNNLVGVVNSLSGVDRDDRLSGLNTISGITSVTGNLSPVDSRMPVDVLDYSLGTYNYPSYLTSYSNHITNNSSNTVSNNSSQMSISPSPTVSSSNTPSNLMSTVGNNVISPNTNTPTNMMSTNTPTSVLTTNTGANNINSVSSSGSGMNDLYWMVRNASRQRFDPDTLDGLNNNRLNSFRVHRVATSSRGGNSMTINSSTQLLNTVNTNQVIANPMVSSNSEDIDMLLPESVFIANWNNLPTRNMDLNVDTSTSALEHRHSAQDLDKPLTRL